MKTRYIIFTILLAGITTFAIGQADLDEPDQPGRDISADTTAVSESSATDAESGELTLEDWMVTPFDTFSEEALNVEPWMKEPFVTSVKESHIPIVVENWMLASR